MGSASRILPSVGWSKWAEIAMIGGMRRRSFQSRWLKYCCYFAQERVSLSRACKYRSLAPRNYLLPSNGLPRPFRLCNEVSIFARLCSFNPERKQRRLVEIAFFHDLKAYQA